MLYYSKLFNELGQYFMFRWSKFVLGRSLVSLHTDGRPESSNCSFDVGKRTSYKAISFCFHFNGLCSIPTRISTCINILQSIATLRTIYHWQYITNVNNTITYKYSAYLLRHHAFWPLYLLCTLLTVPRNWKSVASFVSHQIKAKEDHLMRL